jgi:hypothetical protein
MKKQLFLFLALSVVALVALLLFTSWGSDYLSSHNVPAETPAPLQIVGSSFTYNFDSEKTGEIPSKFHSVRTGPGAPGQWMVIAEPSAPSRPNVVAQNSADPTDLRLVLLVGDEGSFKDFDLSVKFNTVSVRLIAPQVWYFG